MPARGSAAAAALLQLLAVKAVGRFSFDRCSRERAGGGWPHGATFHGLECRTSQQAQASEQKRLPGRAAARRANTQQQGHPKTVFSQLLGRWAEGRPSGTTMAICSAPVCSPPTPCQRAAAPQRASKLFQQPLSEAVARKSEALAGLLKGEEGQTKNRFSQPSRRQCTHWRAQHGQQHL